ncbi:MAG TPA: disulfide bond formation protein B [Steroidobacteraceae bacterium]|nr:disulfide bond formation protein B [Steroidobacteraceae bacterium]
MLEQTRSGWLHRRSANFLGFLWCAFLLAYALYVQYGLDQEPCPLCILQRIAVMAAGAVFLVAFVHDAADRFARIYGALIGLAALAGIGVAARHVWILAQPPGAVAECGASLDYMMDVLPLHEVLGKVLTGSGECAKVTWEFLGISMPAWVLVNLAGLAVLGIVANFVLRKKGIGIRG